MPFNKAICVDTSPKLQKSATDMRTATQRIKLSSGWHAILFVSPIPKTFYFLEFRASVQLVLLLRNCEEGRECAIHCGNLAHSVHRYDLSTAAYLFINYGNFTVLTLQAVAQIFPSGTKISLFAFQSEIPPFSQDISIMVAHTGLKLKQYMNYLALCSIWLARILYKVCEHLRCIRSLQWSVIQNSIELVGKNQS